MPPAVGYSLKVISYFLTHFRIQWRYWPRFLLTLLINLINWPFRAYEKYFINPKYREGKGDPPVIFIIGHWRSGTTHLHNLLCQDPQMGYTTTYQSVFPDTVFNKVGRFLFEGFSRILIPGKRAGDNVRLGTKLPQEEEFTLGANTPLSFYYFWMFPKKLRYFYEKSIRFKDCSPSLLRQWQEDYRLLIRKSLANTKKEVYLSKNPSNTGRMSHLLEVFPNARFIHIHRNPIEVFLSMDNFFRNMMPHLQLQQITPEERKRCIIDLYKALMQDFVRQKPDIPNERLVEIAYCDLIAQPMETLAFIYDSLAIPGFEDSRDAFAAYLEQKEGYEKNKHKVSSEWVDELMVQFKTVLDRYAYDIPKSIEIIS